MPCPAIKFHITSKNNTSPVGLKAHSIRVQYWVLSSTFTERLLQASLKHENICSTNLTQKETSRKHTVLHAHHSRRADNNTHLAKVSKYSLACPRPNGRPPPLDRALRLSFNLLHFVINFTNKFDKLHTSSLKEFTKPTLHTISKTSDFRSLNSISAP